MTNETPPQMAVTVLRDLFDGLGSDYLDRRFGPDMKQRIFAVLDAARLAQQSAATGGEGSGLPDYEAHARERQAQALYFLEPIPSPAHQQWAPSYLDWNDLRDEQKRIYYRRGAVAAERMEALTPTHPNDMARENERLREAMGQAYDAGFNFAEGYLPDPRLSGYAHAMERRSKDIDEILAALSTAPSNPPAPSKEAQPLISDGSAALIKGCDMSAPSDGVLREQVARVIDPLTWGHLDDIRSRKECGYGVQHMSPDEQFAHVDAIGDLTKSLAKADAILALTNPADGVQEALKAAREWICDTEDENPEEWEIVRQIDAALTNPAGEGGVRARALDEAALLCERFTTPYGRAGSEPDAIEGQMRKMASKRPRPIRERRGCWVMAHIVTLDLDSPDPTAAINTFLHVMNAQRALRLTPRTEHVLIEHLMREDVRVLYYSSACGIVSIVEGRDHPMDDDGFDETLEVIDLFAKRRKRKREADRVGDMRREMVAGDLDEAIPTSGSGAGK